jgi:hypothetical protein
MVIAQAARAKIVVEMDEAAPRTSAVEATILR